MEREKKKGFWASLFAPKSCSCSASVIEEVQTNKPTEKGKTNSSDNKKRTPPNNNKSSSCCG